MYPQTTIISQPKSQMLGTTNCKVARSLSSLLANYLFNFELLNSNIVIRFFDRSLCVKKISKLYIIVNALYLNMNVFCDNNAVSSECVAFFKYRLD